MKDIVSKENRNALYAFLGAQCFNIVATFAVAWLLFGVVKPALSSDEGAADNAAVSVELKADALRITGDMTTRQAEPFEDLGRN